MWLLPRHHHRNVDLSSPPKLCVLIVFLLFFHLFLSIFFVYFYSFILGLPVVLGGGICPPGSYCPGGSADPLSCPVGKYAALPQVRYRRAYVHCPAVHRVTKQLSAAASFSD
jgi:hypothetical protein